jgi:hypothetical protein
MRAIRIFCVSLIPALSIALIFLSAEAKASTVEIDFDSAAIGYLLTDDYFEDGFRLQHISGHYDIWPDSGTNNTPYLGLDVINNQVVSEVRLHSITGSLFNLISIDTISISDFDTLFVASSAGGLVEFDTSGTQIFTGPKWKNLSWVSFSSSAGIGGPGLDTITLSEVPIPAAVWLLGSGLIGLSGFRLVKNKHCLTPCADMDYCS